MRPRPLALAVVLGHGSSSSVWAAPAAAAPAAAAAAASAVIDSSSALPSQTPALPSFSSSLLDLPTLPATSSIDPAEPLPLNRHDHLASLKYNPVGRKRPAQTLRRVTLERLLEQADVPQLHAVLHDAQAHHLANEHAALPDNAHVATFLPHEDPQLALDIVTTLVRRHALPQPAPVAAPEAQAASVDNATRVSSVNEGSVSTSVVVIGSSSDTPTVVTVTTPDQVITSAATPGNSQSPNASPSPSPSPAGNSPASNVISQASPSRDQGGQSPTTYIPASTTSAGVVIPNVSRAGSSSLPSNNAPSSSLGGSSVSSAGSNSNSVSSNGAGLSSSAGGSNSNSGNSSPSSITSVPSGRHTSVFLSTISLPGGGLSTISSVEIIDGAAPTGDAGGDNAGGGPGGAGGSPTATAAGSVQSKGLAPGAAHVRLWEVVGLVGGAVGVAAAL